MATYTPIDRSFNAGIPSQGSDTFNVLAEGLITGEYPHQMVQDLPVALNQTLEAYTVVGFDDNGNITTAVNDDEDGVQAIGILMYPVTAAATGALPVGRVLRSACINHLWAGLVWDDSYATAADKANAFEGAPSPTQFITRTLAHGTPRRA